MNPCGNYGSPIYTRREMLQRAGLGIGSLALTALLAEEGRLVPFSAGNFRVASP